MKKKSLGQVAQALIDFIPHPKQRAHTGKVSIHQGAQSASSSE